MLSTDLYGMPRPQRIAWLLAYIENMEQVAYQLASGHKGATTWLTTHGC